MVSPAVHTSLAAVLLNWRFVERAGNKTQQDKGGGGEGRDGEHRVFEYLFGSLEASKKEERPLGLNHLNTTLYDVTGL